MTVFVYSLDDTPSTKVVLGVSYSFLFSRSLVRNIPLLHHMLIGRNRNGSLRIRFFLPVKGRTVKIANLLKEMQPILLCYLHHEDTLTIVLAGTGLSCQCEL